LTNGEQINWINLKKKSLLGIQIKLEAAFSSQKCFAIFHAPSAVQLRILIES